ncbi:hypothetical protein B0H11DRAFT_2196502 [Mycena galericulata]|nr:hypothetical protein B0H11DRAFT_2196502 [Mycena galericulata]
MCDGISPVLFPLRWNEDDNEDGTILEKGNTHDIAGLEGFCGVGDGAVMLRAIGWEYAEGDPEWLSSEKSSEPRSTITNEDPDFKILKQDVPSGKPPSSISARGGEIMGCVWMVRVQIELREGIHPAQTEVRRPVRHWCSPEQSDGGLDGVSICPSSRTRQVRSVIWDPDVWRVWASDAPTGDIRGWLRDGRNDTDTVGASVGELYIGCTAVSELEIHLPVQPATIFWWLNEDRGGGRDSRCQIPVTAVSLWKN